MVFDSHGFNNNGDIQGQAPTLAEKLNIVITNVNLGSLVMPMQFHITSPPCINVIILYF